MNTQVSSWVKGLACALILTTLGFNNPQPIEVKVDGIGTRLVTLESDEFNTYTKTLYARIDLNGSDSIPFESWEYAIRGYTYLRHTDALSNDRYLTLIDFSQFCNKNRMWVIDLKERKVIFNEMVAHGARTGDEFAKYFSNSHGSKRSSLGFYTTGGEYWGSNQLSLKLNGLEKGFNSNAYSRGIVIHGANYVGDDYLRYNKRIGRSYGCPAVPAKVNKKIIDTIQEGSCLFIYHPTPSYLENSKILTDNLYITVKQLEI